ncbi:DUF3329 domain-containing protein [Aurantimonas sp. C2-6-R+9]|uniref:DUF3329 domain-containing protein n=1 Tax=unclassified Aurantimonas TaxID=2638230 RepID=UPI002E186A9A|nr:MULTISPECIES: DUF3329 domain-containing protein [unclassified Aurantimonas]MEC5293362.1 DUF3329 domain-containing protein [Aurantimonas sp. C2-3-R2]MEC5325750.1 DUF3329 domain-containing protein [Aurantimonas sp. A3-2-R12]MEC5383543.1 DUF3329 domain-containing protein [Aurantimonas sp. C2-6-R+9]MEC5414444.1 DUF3329 domain-containing protein [Aurantimonas sp. C2-4-R8]
MRRREAEHPFYRPLWIRVCLTGVLVVWTALEWARDEPFWGIMTSAAAVWAIWTFFLTYDPNAAGAKAPAPGEGTAANDTETSEGK